MNYRLMLVALCAGLASAQHQLPNYFSGSFQVPSAPIPQPGNAAPAYQAHQAPAQAYQAQPRYAPQSPVAFAQPQYQAAYPSQPLEQPAPAPVSGNYGWSVQHSSPQPAPVAAPTPAAYQPQPQQYAPQPQPQQQLAAAQYAAQFAAQQQRARAATLAQTYPAQPQAQQYAPQAQPQAAAAPAPTPAFMRPAQVHYANIGETLAGDYKFGYRTGDGSSHREESRLPDGTVQGQYGFVDADGKERIVKYTAGVNGFQVLNDAGQAQAPARAARAAAPAAQPNWAQQGQWQQPAAPAAPAPQWS